MKESILFLNVAKDEIETIIQYLEMLNSSEEEREASTVLDEIIGDEFNHALISILTAANILSIEIPADGLKQAEEGVEIEADKNASQEGSESQKK